MGQCAKVSNIHNLFDRTLIAWCGGQLAGAPTLAAPPEEWAAPPSEDEGANEDGAAAAAAESQQQPASGAAQDWTKWNQKQQRDSRKFAQSKPAGVLLLSYIVLSCLCCLQRRVEVVDSAAWERQALHKGTLNLPFQTRMSYMASLDMTNTFFAQIDPLLGADSRWELLPARHYTVQYSNMAMAMLCIALCGVEQLMHSKHNSYPVRLFKLLFDPSFASTVLHECEDLFDSATAKFLTIYNTVALLSGKAARYSLLGAAVLLRRSIQRIECRNAALRRRIKQRVQTHSERFAGVSASFLLMRQRIVEHT